jgi:thiamine kinase-like enzyme
MITPDYVQTLARYNRRQNQSLYRAAAMSCAASHSKRKERMTNPTLERVARLGIWRGNVAPEPLSGGLSNQNFKVIDRGEAFVVRVTGPDQPVHGLLRAHEIAASRAAFAAGLAPELIHAEEGLTVLRWVEGEPLTEARLREPAMIDRIAPLLRHCHEQVGLHVRGAAPFFWVFHSLRCYLDDLSTVGQSPRDLGDLATISAELEQATGAIEIGFAHNDMIPGNFLDDGERLWLIDWEYAGYGSPLFDVAGVVIHGDLDRDGRERVYRRYYGKAPGPQAMRRYAATIAAAALREALWAHVQVAHSVLALDYAAHAKLFDDRFRAAYDRFRAGAD